MFLHIHLWVHMILSNSILPSSDSEPFVDVPHLGRTGVITPIAQLDRSGAKLICEYLSLCSLVNPAIYYTHSYLGQPLFTAGQVIIRGEVSRRIAWFKLTVQSYGGRPCAKRRLTTLIASLI